MFKALGRAVAHHPWRFVVLWVLIVSAFGAATFWGYGQGDLFDRLYTSLPTVKDSESDQVSEATEVPDRGPIVTVVVKGVNTADQAQGAAIMQAMEVHRPQLSGINLVVSEQDPFLAGPPQPDSPAMAMMSTNKDGFLFTLTLKFDMTTAEKNEVYPNITTAVDSLQEDLQKISPDAECLQLSDRALGNAVIDQIQEDLVHAETIGLPIALILLIIVFGGLLLAGMPIVSALVAITIGMGGLWLITFAQDVESFILNVVSIIGLGLSIDYGLLIVSRYREELQATLEFLGYSNDGKNLPDKVYSRQIVREVVQETVSTAGRTVFFSALTIAMSLMALFIMKAEMLKTIAAGGMIVTILAVTTAVTLVPAMITILNRKLMKPSVVTKIPLFRRLVQAVGDSSSDTGFFSKLAHAVHRHPWLIMIAVFAILAVMAAPLLQLVPRTAFSDYMPEGNTGTIAYQTIQKDYPAAADSTIIIVADATPEAMVGLVQHVKGIADVGFVGVPSPTVKDPSRSAFGFRIDVDNQVGSQVTQDVKDLRNYDAGFDIQVGGPAALQLDFVDSIVDGAPLALGVIIAAVFILLFLMTGSVIIPFKALIINCLSLFSALGATSFIFMHGWFGMPQQLGMETFVLACAVCFGFGLAMDYEVFLIARIKEYWDNGDDSDHSVAHGLQRSGRIITSAAAIIVAVFIGFTFGVMVPIKELGLALAITILTDATLVRLLLVPSTMTIMGHWNWWSPPPLRWLYSKFHITH